MTQEEKVRYDEYMDEECISLCDKLNSLSSVETTESCCGHCRGPCNTPYKEAIEDLFHVYINPKTKRLLPCWSLAALLGVLPNENIIDKTSYGKYYCLARNIITENYDNPVDACVAMIERLHEQNLL